MQFIIPCAGNKQLLAKTFDFNKLQASERFNFSPHAFITLRTFRFKRSVKEVCDNKNRFNKKGSLYFVQACSENDDRTCKKF